MYFIRAERNKIGKILVKMAKTVVKIANITKTVASSFNQPLNKWNVVGSRSQPEYAVYVPNAIMWDIFDGASSFDQRPRITLRVHETSVLVVIDALPFYVNHDVVALRRYNSGNRGIL